MRNTANTDNIIVRKAIAELTTLVPATWKIEELQFGRVSRRPDATVLITAADGRQATVLIEAKSRLEPKDIDGLIRQLQGYEVSVSTKAGALVVATPFVSPRARAMIRSAGAGYVDLAGNVLVRVDDPALYIERQGANENPNPRERPARSLKGPKAAGIVRALIDFRPPLGTRQLAAISGADPGYVSRILNLLDREALVHRKTRGPVEGVDWPELLVRWTQDYSVIDSNLPSSYIDPRGLQALVARMRGLGLDAEARCAVTGSLAVPRAAATAPGRLAMIYVDDADAWANRLGLTPTETGANVLLLEPLGEVVFERTRVDDGLRCVALSQAVADLLTGPGRNPAEGETLLTWMRQHENEWRVGP
ncbi:MAG: hypothetical protein JW990_21690 [Thermoleophilia bacterium]|nr:hypothetical protein [Thermoleophilia bacterium]